MAFLCQLTISICGVNIYSVISAIRASAVLGRILIILIKE